MNSHMKLECAGRLVVVAVVMAGAVTGQSQPAVSRGFGELLSQAPPHIDKALRGRIQLFYSLHHDRKWRQADQLVHAQSQDAFFEADKITFRGFKIVSTVYEENFTRARAVVDIDTDLAMAGFGELQVNRPLVSSWRLDDGQWCWYTAARTDTSALRLPPGASGAGIIGGPDSLKDFVKAIQDLQNRVTVDRPNLTLPSHRPATAEIVVTNAWENRVHLSIDVPELAGLTLSIDTPILEAGRQARIRIASTPQTNGALPPIQAILRVAELSKSVQIDIAFLPPPPAADVQ